MSPACWVRTNLRTSFEAHESKSSKALICVMFAVSTNVDDGNAAAVALAPSGDVKESRSPSRTRVGTSGSLFAPFTR